MASEAKPSRLCGGRLLRRAKRASRNDGLAGHDNFWVYPSRHSGIVDFRIKTGTAVGILGGMTLKEPHSNCRNT